MITGVEFIKEQLPEFAKDIKLNLSQVLTVDSSDQLNETQLLGTALAVAFAKGQNIIIDHLLTEANKVLSEQQIAAAKSAAVIMSMNNVYYRFSYLIEDHEIEVMPAKLRMNAINSHGIDKIDYELYSLGVSILNGCGKCVVAHAKQIAQHGLPKLAIQHIARIAAVINAASVAITLS